MAEEMQAKSGDETQIAYCGLYCGDCPIRHGRVAELAGELLAELKRLHFHRLARGLAERLEEFRPLVGYGRCCQVLATLEEVRCEEVCRRGGGTTGCPIRACCQTKQIEGCWLCDEFEGCDRLAWLNPIHGNACRKNLRVIAEQGKAAFLDGKRCWFDVEID